MTAARVPSMRKNKFNARTKLSLAFDRSVLNMYKNNIFPTLPCVVVEIHDITADFCMLYPF